MRNSKVNDTQVSLVGEKWLRLWRNKILPLRPMTKWKQMFAILLYSLLAAACASPSGPDTTTGPPPNAQDQLGQTATVKSLGTQTDSEPVAAKPYVNGRWATVVRVVDGDTVELEGGEKVRLIGVDTPETVKPGTPVQPYGKEASKFTKSKVEGKKVFLETDVQTKDLYGRTLAYVYVKEPKNREEVETYMLNAMLLREGYAQLMTIQPNSRYADLFAKLQRQARESKKGMWASPNPQPRTVYYRNCTEAREAGVTPIYRGQPGYAAHLDRDGDGIACE